MDCGTWKQPVILEIPGQPGPVIVASTLDAAVMLLRAWPARRNEASVAAVTTCRDVLKGRSSAARARSDFIEAALEAGFHVQPQTFLGGTESIDGVPTPSAALPNALAHLAPLAPFRRMAGKSARLSQLVPPLADAEDREAAQQYHRPVIIWSEPDNGSPVSAPLNSKAACLRDSFGQLASTLGIIARHCARSAAGGFQFHVRRRRSGHAAGADASLGRS